MDFRPPRPKNPLSHRHTTNRYYEVQGVRKRRKIIGGILPKTEERIKYMRAHIKQVLFYSWKSGGGPNKTIGPLMFIIGRAP